MATDSTHLLTGDTSVETDTDMSAGGPDLGSVQLAAASPDAPIPVNIPRGQQVVVIPVRPGQTIELPTDSVNGLLAKLGADGNLAIVVDGRTIILQGYAEANAESPIKIVTNDGDVIDIADVIVATNPDVALDIQTAAGPAAGAQGGTNGSDAASSGIFVPFAAGPLLGGFDGEGVLKATQLAYKNIDDERELFPVLEEEKNNLPKTIVIVPDDGQPTAEDGAFQLDEDFLPPNSPGGNKDDPAPSLGDDDGSNIASGTVVVDFGLDGPRANDPIVMSPIVNPNSGLFALSGGSDPTVPGGQIQLVLDAPAGGQQVLHGVLNGIDYFTITLDTSTGHFVVEQLQPLFHDERSLEDNVFLNIDFSAFDSNNDELTATLHLDFDDDMPEILATEEPEFKLGVDETVSLFKSDSNDPKFNGSPLDGSAIEGDENLVALPAELTGIGTVIGAATADASVLFDVKIGADGFANNKALHVYSLTILDKNTGLTDTETQDSIYLIDNNGVIEGRADDGDDQTPDPVVFALTIDPISGEVSMAQYRAIDHGDEEAAPGAHDEVLFLGDGHLAATLTVVDGDGDEASKDVDIGGAISFDDDGPQWTYLGRSNFFLDEDDLPNGVAGGPGDNGAGTLSTGHIGFAFGSDLPGTLSIGALTVRNQLGAVIALEDLRTADGHDITINKSVDAGTGIITWQGVVADGPNAGDPVFTFTLDGSGANIGNYTFALHAALEHPFTDADAKNDGPDTAFEDDLQFSFTVVATDGDGDTATRDIDLFVNDDSPRILLNDAAISLAVDETVGGNGTDVNDPWYPFPPQDGTTIENDEDLVTLPQVLTDIGVVIGAATADASKLFSVQLGADGGAAADAESFSLKIQDANTGLTDTASGDPIILVDNNGVIEGRAVDGDANTVDPVVFALTVDKDGNISMAQYRAIDHGDEENEGGTAFDEVLYLGTGKLAVELTATDADGDKVTATSDLGNAISFDDDGPTANDDEDSVTEDGPIVATGNVITGQDTTPIGGVPDANTTDGKADTGGADGLDSITWDGVDKNNVIDTPYGKLTVDANGNYKYELDNESPAVQELKAGETKQEVFTYTITDGDGDKDTATLTITITGANDGPKIDLDPNDTKTDDETAVVSDEGLTGGLKDGVGDPSDDTDSKSFTSPFTVTDPDGDPLTVKMLDTGTFPAWTFGGTNDVVQWTLSLDGLTLTGEANGSDALTVVFDPVGHTYTVTLHQPLNHPAPNAEDELSFNITVEVSDGSATDTAILTVQVEDDSPVVELTHEPAFLLAVDETVDAKGGGDADADGENGTAEDGSTAEGDEQIDPAKINVANTGLGGLGTVIGAATADADDLFSGAPGADQEGSHAFTLDIKNGGVTQLKDTQTGQFIQLVSEGGYIKGVVPDGLGGTLLVFALDIDDQTGQVTMAQYRAVDHGSDLPDDSFPDEVISLGQTADGKSLLEVTYSITDKDGDSDSESVDLGDLVTFDDDGPDASKIEFSVGKDGEDALLVHDETSGVQDGDDDATDPDASDAVQDEDDVASRPLVFKAFEEAAGNADDLPVAPIGYASIPVNLDLSGGTPNGDAAYGSDGPGTTTIELTDGNGDPFNGDKSNLSDTATGRSIFLYTEDGLVVGRIGTAGNLADPDGEIAFAISIDGDSLDVAQYRAIKHTDTGTADESSPVLALTGTDVSTTIYATITVTDEDGDQVTKQVPFDGIRGNPGIVFQDDGPTAPTFEANNNSVVHDETPGIQNGGVGDLDGDDVAGSTFISGGAGPTVASLFAGLVAPLGNDPDVVDNPIGYARSGSALVTPVGGSASTDGEASHETSLDVSSAGAFSGVSTTEGTDIFLYKEGDLIVGRVGNEDAGGDTANDKGEVAFAIAIDPVSGEVFTVQYLSLKHGDAPSNYDEPASLIDGAVQVTVTITDKDGDVASASDNIGAQIIFEDDGPGAMAAEAAAITEDEEFNAPTDEAAGEAGDPTPDLDASVSGNVSDNGNWGADGFGRITQVQIGANAAVAVPNGGSVTVYWGQDGSYQGTTAAGAAASLVVNSNGTYTFTQLDNLLIASGAGELIDLIGSAVFTGVDGDGDAATISLDLKVKDDIPGSMAAEAAAITEDEEFNAPTDEAAGEAGDPTPDLDASVSGNVSDNGNWGADGFGRITQVQIGANAAVAVPNGGSVTVYWSQDGTYQGTTAAGAAASLVVNSNGTYTFTQLDNLLISGVGEQIDLIGSAVFTGVDGDGDAATISLDLKVKDDIPGSMAAEAAAIVEDEQIAPGIDEAAGVAGDPNPDLGASVIGNVSDNGNWGADGFGRISQVQIGGNAAVAVPNGGSVTVYWSQTGVYQGTTAAGAAASLQISSTGAYTFTLLDNMLIASGAGELIDSLGTATFTGADGDGDTATITMALSVKDDIPAFISPDTLHLENKGVVGPTDQVAAALNFATGADGVGNVVFNVPGVVVGIVPPALGLLAEDSAGNDLKVGGQQLYLYYGGAGGTDTTILVAKTVAGVVGFTIDIDPVTGTYIYNQEAPISNGTEVSATDLSGLGGGNVPFKLLINVGGTQQDVAMTTENGESVNTNVDTIGISGGQRFTTGEAIRFDLVNGLTHIEGNGGDPDEFDYDGTHNLTNGWKQLIQIDAANDEASIIVSAIRDNDGDENFFSDPSDDRIDLDETNIKIYDQFGALITDYVANGITVDDNGGKSVTITGLEDNWSYQIVTVGDANKFNAIKVEAAPGTDSFALGFFSYGDNSAGTSIDLSYDVVGTDGDGDKATGEIDISLYPDATSSSGPSFAGTIASETFLGNQSANIIDGAGGNDLLAGNGGIDTITGGTGNDTIIGGAGGDILDGGDGNDVFVYETLVDGGDKISNFNTAAGGDKLDVKEVLDHDGNTWDDTVSGTTAAAIAGGYITFTDGGGGNVQVNVDIDGAGTAHGAVAVAVLTGVTLASAQGGALDDNIVVN
jgi:VCBS repeat-containing protein